MRKVLIVTFALLFSTLTYAQFGNIKHKWEIDSLKAYKIVVVLFPDSAYSESVMQAMEDYWNFSDFEFAEDTSMYRYKKTKNYYLLFSKSRGSKNKSRLCSSSEDFNGFVITNKYNKKIYPENVVAYAHVRNNIDTIDWQTIAITGVQLLKNYLQVVDKAESEKDFNNNLLFRDYPTEKNLLLDKTLMMQPGSLDMKGKEDPVVLFNGSVEESFIDEIQARIVNQDNNYLYFYTSKDDKYCHKFVLTTAGSELLYYSTTSPDKCGCNSKDLKDLKAMKDRLLKKNK